MTLNIAKIYKFWFGALGEEMSYLILVLSFMTTAAMKMWLMWVPLTLAITLSIILSIWKRITHEKN